MSNNVYAMAGRETLEEEARRWIVRLDGEEPLSDREAVELRDWIDRSPVHRQELRRLARFWQQADVLTELAIPLKPVSRYRRSWLAPRKLVAAMACLVTAGVASWALFWPSPVTHGVYGTVVGQQRTLHMGDGSVIELNTDSQIQVSYSENQRGIRLLRGQAHFDVAKDVSRPFEVAVGSGIVRAVGTSFSVYLADDEIDVAVTEGKVALASVEHSLPERGVQSSKTEVRVRPLGVIESGQTASFSRTIHEIRDVPLVQLKRRESWRDGVLVFSGEPLSEVVAEVSRYTPITIEIADPSLVDLKVGGRFKVGELDQVFDALEAVLGVKVIYLGSQHVELRAAGRSSSGGVSPAAAS